MAIISKFVPWKAAGAGILAGVAGTEEMAFTTTAGDTFTDQRASTFTLAAGGATAGGVGAVAVPTGSTYTFASRPQGMAGQKVYVAHSLATGIRTSAS